MNYTNEDFHPPPPKKRIKKSSKKIKHPLQKKKQQTKTQKKNQHKKAPNKSKTKTKDRYILLFFLSRGGGCSQASLVIDKKALFLIFIQTYILQKLCIDSFYKDIY